VKFGQFSLISVHKTSDIQYTDFQQGVTPWLELTFYKKAQNATLTHYRPAMPSGNRKIHFEDLFSSIVLQFLNKISPLWKPEI